MAKMISQKEEAIFMLKVNRFLTQFSQFFLICLFFRSLCQDISKRFLLYCFENFQSYIFLIVLQNLQHTMYVAGFVAVLEHYDIISDSYAVLSTPNP